MGRKGLSERAGFGGIDVNPVSVGRANNEVNKQQGMVSCAAPLAKNHRCLLCFLRVTIVRAVSVMRLVIITALAQPHKKSESMDFFYSANASELKLIWVDRRRLILTGG